MLIDLDARRGIGDETLCRAAWGLPSTEQEATDRVKGGFVDDSLMGRPVGADHLHVGLTLGRSREVASLRDDQQVVIWVEAVLLELPFAAGDLPREPDHSSRSRAK